MLYEKQQYNAACWLMSNLFGYLRSKYSSESMSAKLNDLVNFSHIPNCLADVLLKLCLDLGHVEGKEKQGEKIGKNLDVLACHTISFFSTNPRSKHSLY